MSGETTSDISSKLSRVLGGNQVEIIGSGFNATGYRVTTERGETYYARTLNSGTLGAPYETDAAKSLLEASVPIPHGLKSKVFGLTPQGAIDLSQIQGFIHIGDLLPPGSINFLDQIISTTTLEETEALVRSLYPFGRSMAEVAVAIHNDTSILKPANTDELYDRGTGTIIYNHQLTAGVVDHLLKQQPVWIQPEDTDLLISQMIKVRRTLGTHPERLTRIHGDFWAANFWIHPERGAITSDRRTVWGEPADDTVSMIADLLAEDLYRLGSFGGPFTRLSQTMLNHYIEQRGDHDITKYIPLKYGFKTLAEATFTPGISDEQRRQIFATGIGALELSLQGENFDLNKLNNYTSQGLTLLK